MTFDFPDNDIRMSKYITEKTTAIARHGRQTGGVGARQGPYTVTQYQITHTTGGTVMGADPSTSVVNPFLQSWDVSNVFVTGASNFSQNASYNPTDTVGALAYRAAEAIVGRYLKNPRPAGGGMKSIGSFLLAILFGFVVMVLLCAGLGLSSAGRIYYLASVRRSRGGRYLSVKMSCAAGTGISNADATPSSDLASRF